MIFNSIRWRVQVWHGLLLVVVLTAFGLTAYQVARNNMMRRIDQELEQRLSSGFRPPMEDPINKPHPDDMSPGKLRPPSHPPFDPPRRPGDPWERRDPRDGPGFFRVRMKESLEQAIRSESGSTNVFYFIIWENGGSVVARSSGSPENVPMPQARERPNSSVQTNDSSSRNRFRPRPAGGMSSTPRARGEFREAYRFMPFGDCALVGRSMATDLMSMRRLAFWLGGAGCAVLILGLAGGWWVASRAIRPIEDISATAVKIAAGDFSQRINAADSDSELGRLIGVLNSTFARLEAAFAQQAQFTSDASHELRTPISVIVSQTQSALARERDASEYREALEACQRAAQRMRKLAESLLELARLDAGQEMMKHERFDLSRVARESIDFVRPLAGERGIEIQSRLPAVDCLGDAERIGQVVTNLLTNAIQFNRDQGAVRVQVIFDAGRAILEVADTGQGIPAKDLPHIFERFYRVDKSRSRVQGRSGLGLAICQAIVIAHGGSIDVSSQCGSGSVFRVRLPTGA